MTDEQTIIDGNAIYKHTKKLFSEKEFRQRFERLDFMHRTPKQIEIFDSKYKFLNVRAGNRSGKSEAACMYSACALLDRWPTDYAGFNFVRPNIARTVTFNEWMIGPTSVSVRDVQAAKMIGGLTQDELGTGWLPLSALRHPITLSRGISGLADKVLVTRDDGSLASLSFKTQEMSREAFQGDAVDLIVLDEDPGRKGGEVWPELTARIIGTGGRILHTATPLAGPSPIRKFFKEPGHPDRGEIRMSIYDNTFLTPEDITTAESSYSEREKMTRLYGDDLPGHGAVFGFPEDTYLHDRQPEDIDPYWKWINGMDFSHFGGSSQSHPWAFVSCAVDPATGAIYVMHATRIKQQLPPVHVAAMKKWALWDSPCSYGADGHQRDSSGSTFAGIYKSLGIPMRQTHATLKGGSVSLEASIAIMEQMLATGQLKISRRLTELRAEIRDYAYDENNKVIAEDDDLVSALRYAVMDARYAQVMVPLGEAARGWDGSWKRRSEKQRAYFPEGSGDGDFGA